MTTPCPLYYNAADFMAAFSRGMESPQIPATRPEGGGRRLRTARPRLMAGIGRAMRSARSWRPIVSHAAPGVAARTKTGEPVGNAGVASRDRQASHAEVRRQGLTSHFELLAAAD